MTTARPLLCLALTAGCTAQDGPPAEFGRIAWQRDFAAASAQAEREHAPLLLLFQEVPG
ncbi:MAG: hypothetical protein KDE27_31545 [Planctomycetes bacterium]|nr:hypothetical protein [Planctomycetota bacterium]